LRCTYSAFIDCSGVLSARADPVLECSDLFSKAFERMSEDEKKGMDAEEFAKNAM